ncbi:MAG: hypothetical protein V3S29_06820 [bacterium]
MKTKMQLFPLLVVVCAALAGCAKVYQPPQPGEPAATVKLQFAYDAIQHDSTLRVSMKLREGGGGDFARALQADFGEVSQGQALPEVPMQQVLVRPKKNTAIELRLAFWWNVPRLVSETTEIGRGPATRRRMVHDFHERGCSAAIRLDPQPGATYLLKFLNPSVDRGCSLKAFRQTVAGAGEIELTPVGEPLEAGQ